MVVRSKIISFNLTYIIIGLICISCLKVEEEEFDPVSYVNLFIGTAGDHGQLDPAACVPFGMVKLGPDTDPINHSGYNYEAKKITGFSHNRIGGVGCRGAGGNIRVKPGVGELSTQSEVYEKETENANPGYYSVTFNSGIKAEVTATNQVGYHRYTFPRSDSAYVAIDPTSSFVQVLEHEIITINENEITGFVKAQNVCNQGAYTTYFVIYANEPFTQIEKIGDKLFWKLKTEAQKEIILKVVLSPISIDQAERDFKARYVSVEFDEARYDAAEKWQAMLSRVEVSGQREYKTLFYTHLYHSLLTPVNTTSSDHTFKGTDGKIHKAEGYTHYDSWSMWDTFRTKFPLLTILYPEVAQDFVYSMEDLYQSGKVDWSGLNEPVPTVRTEHSIVFLLDAYQKGIEVNWEKIYPRLSKEMDSLSYTSPGKVLESSYDKWAMAEIAKILNKDDDANRFSKESKGYRPIWEKYFKNINDSSDIMHAYGLYEGTIWQYRWHVQFDIEGLIDLLGGKEAAKEQLQFFFENNLYNHGNQPDIHTAFLFNRLGAPELTQYWVNKILTKNIEQHYGTHDKFDNPNIGRIYKDNPKGYIPEMDDDDGTMSAWYVLSAMGLYPLVVGEPAYELSAPIFDKLTIRPNDENPFTILAREVAEDQFYIESTTLNGSAYLETILKYSDIQKGGTLEYVLSNNPLLNDKSNLL